MDQLAELSPRRAGSLWWLCVTWLLLKRPRRSPLFPRQGQRSSSPGREPLFRWRLLACWRNGCPSSEEQQALHCESTMVSARK